MPEFNTFDLGKVLQTAEVIKGMRRESENDRMRNLYMGEQVEHMRASRPIAQAQENRAQQTFTREGDALTARHNYLVAQAVEASADPHAAIRQYSPEFIEEVDGHYGSGSFERMTPDQLKQAMGQAKQFYGAKAGFGAQGTPEQQAAAAERARNADTQFEREKEVIGIQHGNRLEEIDRQGRYAQERTAATNDRRDFKDAQSMRKEFEGLDAVKNYKAVLPIIKSAQSAPDTGYGDLDLIYATGKILDPNSVVREGELALTIAAGSPLQRIIGSTRFSTENGGRLTAKSRQQLLAMLNGRVGALRDQFENERQRYAGYARDSGWKEDSVVGAAQSQGGGPKVGDVEDGYRFKGGNPADPNSWEKAN